MAAEHQGLFLSLHGKDVPEGVLSYLKTGLERSGISVFKRDKRGSEDRRTVLKKIRESSFALVIFTVDFAKSGECLDELAMVEKRMDIGKLSTIPIYYKVEPDDVIHVQGSFGNMLQWLEKEEHRTAMGNGMEALLRTEVRLRYWREALVSVTATRGFIYQEDADFIEEISKQVHKASARNDEASRNIVPLSQVTVKERMESLVFFLTSIDVGFQENFSSESDSIDKLSEQFRKQLNKFISQKTRNKEDANPIQEFEKSPRAHNQVFINYRRRDVQSTLLTHLLDALKKDGIKVNDANAEFTGKVPSLEAIPQLIRESCIALVILSPNYTQSKWCLHELMIIIEYVKKGMLTVIPIFYNVKVDDVRSQRGSFGDNFRDLSRTAGKDKMRKYKKALQYVTTRIGLVYDTTSSRSGSEFIMELMAVIKQLLADASSDD